MLNRKRVSLLKHAQRDSHHRSIPRNKFSVTFGTAYKRENMGKEFKRLMVMCLSLTLTLSHNLSLSVSSLFSHEPETESSLGEARRAHLLSRNALSPLAAHRRSASPFPPRSPRPFRFASPASPPSRDRSPRTAPRDSPICVRLFGQTSKSWKLSRRGGEETMKRRKSHTVI